MSQSALARTSDAGGAAVVAPEGAPEAPAPDARRIPSLDGLRAVSILLVLVGHASGTRGAPRPPAIVDSLGEFGVRVFFVISGYLITRRLLDEHARTGSISLASFYRRRARRILPAFLTFVAVILGLAATGVIALAPGDALHALTFTMNHHPARSWWVGHIWSLSVEEQFYLLWPAILLLAGLRGGLRAAAATLVLAPIARVAVWRFFPSARVMEGELFPTICDSVAVGCVLAGARARLDRSPTYLRALASPAAILLPLVALAVHQLWRHPSLYFPVGHTVVDVSIALTLDRVVRFPPAFLNAAVVTWIGRLSYSLYLWQQPFLNRGSTSPLCAFPVNLALAFAVATLSYYAIERPFLEHGKRKSRGLAPA